ncbi:hypothetical protein B0H19DRAFT_1248387 [Mycena capillaripes]|nr:hypothetical protein B0H19DRAFT_1248387 [Mycena capillaripes]
MSLGFTLTSGIQDISAFLPIFGTDQCEKHVGAALEKGFLYAAAAPLSIFGCLGIVKAALAIFVASITWPFNGARLLRNAGFELQGSVAAMIGTSPNNQEEDFQYYVESRFGTFLTENDIENTAMGIQHVYASWNRLFLATSLPLGCLAIVPYIPFIIDPDASFSTWFYPFIRVLGSVMCSVSAQFVLQIRIKRILRGSKWIPFDSVYREVEGWCCCCCCHEFMCFWVFRGFLCAGSVATAAGYTGCFNLVQRSSTRQTFTWIGLEALLAVLRVVLWGCNHKFDKGTCLILKLRGQVPRQTTTPLAYEAQIVAEKQTFSGVRDREFLRQMRGRMMRPGARCIKPDTVTQIFYSTALSDNKKELHLLTTIYNPLNDPIVVVRSRASDTVQVYSATCTLTDTTGVMQIQLLGSRTIPFARPGEAFQEISKHSKEIIERFGDPRLRINRFRLSWTGEIERFWSADERMYEASVTVV